MPGVRQMIKSVVRNMGVRQNIVVLMAMAMVLDVKVIDAT